MINNLIVVDTREKGNQSIIKYFDEVKQDYIISKLESADYMIYKDYSILIDKKDSLLEICGNLCHTSEHDRVVREINLSHELGCQRFIFLICETKYKCLEDVKKWSNIHSKVSGETLYKVLDTFAKHHNVEYIFAPRKDLGKEIISILSSKINNIDIYQ